jgi:cation:H+ antiporter
LLYSFLVAGFGLVVLLLSGDFLLRGAISFSNKLGISKLIIGLTVVAFGTSAPELLISIRAVLDGVSGLAIGNVVGSNIANILLVIGLPASVAGLPLVGTETQKPYLIMIASSILFICISFFGVINLTSGLILFFGFVFVFTYTVVTASKKTLTPSMNIDETRQDPNTKTIIAIFLILLGLVGLPLGTNLFVDSAIAISQGFGVSEALIGLTLVAVGTSLPELATMIVATFRRETDLAIGNIIGSNVFNLLAIMGISSFFGNINVPTEFLTFDLWCMLFSSLLLAPVVFGWFGISQIGGVFLILIYAVYLSFVVSV